MKSLDLDHVVVHTTDMTLEAKNTQLHKHLNSTRIREDDDKTVVIVITPAVCSSSRSTSCSIMSTLSTFF